MTDAILAKLFDYALFKPAYYNELTMSWSGHLVFANFLINELRPEKFVELGTHYGVSLFSFCQAVADAGLATGVYAVDSWTGDPQAGLYDEGVYKQVSGHAARHYPFAILIRSTFDAALRKFAPESIDLLHIDGLHTYEAAKHDFEAWLPRVKPGGIVLFHDVCEYGPGFGVHQLWSEIGKLSDETYLFSHSSGLGVWRKPGGPLLGSTLLNMLFDRHGKNCALIDAILSQSAVKQALDFKVQCVTSRASLFERQRNDLHSLLTKTSEQGLQIRQEFERKIAALQEEKAELDQKNASRLARLENDLALEREENSRLKSELEDFRRAAQSGETVIADTRSELQKAKTALLKNERQLHEAHSEIGRMLQSRSWRITAPLRRIAHRMRYSKYGIFRKSWRLAKRICDKGTGSSDIQTAMPAEAQAIPIPAPAPVAYEVEKPVETCSSTRLIAFYLPQFHTFPENDKWWGKGFTDWINVRRSRPFFPGHAQPEIPHESLGYYDLADPEIMRKQAEIAKRHGIYGFCFHHYYFAGKRLMEKPVDQFLEHPEIDMPFCLCWANENWTRRWDGEEDDVLISQNHSPEDDLAFWDDISRYFTDSRYIRVQGRPVLVVYYASLLPDMMATINRWRQRCKDRNLPPPYLLMAQSFNNYDPRVYGFDAAVQFPPHNGRQRAWPAHTVEGLAEDFSGSIFSYDELMDLSMDYLEDKFPNYPCVCPSWDNTPRRLGNASVFVGSTPARYAEWLSRACRFVAEHFSADRRFVFINAWNEWGEGAHLEPDTRTGYAYLNATGDALVSSGASTAPHLPLDDAHRLSVLAVGHDAGRSGAQKLLLDLLQWLGRRTSVECHLWLLGGGALVPDYEDVVPVMISDPKDTPPQQILDFCGQKPDLVLGNTVVSAAAYETLAPLDIPIVTFAHELETSLKKYASPEIIDAMRLYSQGIIGASEAVCANLVARHGIARKDCLALTAFITSFPAAAPGEKRLLRQKLGLPETGHVVMGCGILSHRKGFDLFVEVAQKVRAEVPDTVFCWPGTPDDTCHMNLDMVRRDCPYIILPWEVEEIQEWYKAADLFLLTSREDPFPLVSLEAACAAIPVICFAETGGMPEFVGTDAGIVVPRCDVAKMAASCVKLLRNSALREKLGQGAREKVLAQATTDVMAPRILAYLRKAAGKKAPVSVIVPNYNYARYLDERIESIINQSWQDFELILLDDASTDDSLAKLSAWQKRTGAKLITNSSNSGNVFKQWEKGLAVAQGQYIWIAEADDLCGPDFLRAMLANITPDTVLAYAIPDVIDANGAILPVDYRTNYLAFASQSRWNASYHASGREEILEALGIVNSIPNVSAAIFKNQACKEAIRRASHFQCSGDWMFYLTLAKTGAIAYCHEARAFHRRHDDSVVNANQNRRTNVIKNEMQEIHRYVKRKYEFSPENVAKMEEFERSAGNS